jgi:hypothetical protein
MLALPCVANFCFAQNSPKLTVIPVQWFEDVQADIASANEVTPPTVIHSPSDFSQLLNKPCGNPNECGIPFQLKDNQTRIATTCKAFFAITDRQYPQMRNDAQRLSAYRATCVEFELLSQAKPAVVSYLDSFQLNKKTVFAFPSEMSVCTEAEDCKFTHRHFKTLGAAFQRKLSGIGDKIHFKKFKEKNARHASYSTDLVERNLTVLARGDFNGDGIEDVMVKVEDTCGREYYWGIYVLTKKSKRGAYELVGKNFYQGA